MSYFIQISMPISLLFYAKISSDVEFGVNPGRLTCRLSEQAREVLVVASILAITNRPRDSEDRLSLGRADNSFCLEFRLLMLRLFQISHH